MNVTIRGDTEGLRRGMSFGLSALLHGAALAWLAVGAAWLDGGAPPSFYDVEIRPHESQIIWYGVDDKLPDVKPTIAEKRPRPPRAIRSFHQAIVSHAREDARPPQMILAAAPEIRIPKPLPLPNILAVERAPRPPLRAFVPPTERPIAKTVPLPEAPLVPVLAGVKELALGEAPAAPPPVAFRPPEAKRATKPAAVLPAAPELAPPTPSLAAPRVPRGFTPPEAERPRPAIPAFDPPPVSPAPSLSVPEPPAPTVAIVGLNPVEVPKVSPPPISHDAGFSAGPKPRSQGGDTDSKDAAITASGLLVRGGPQDPRAALVASLTPPTSTRSLMDSVREAREEGFSGPPPSGAALASHAPDPRLDGRPVYVMAIQMPNITSDSGSWMVWFADHDAADRAPRTIVAPVPLRKVDPKYIASAREERVEGKVRLFAIIRKTGEVDSVELLERLDPRLDRSAVEALLKWRFQPALRDGVPVDVEAVFEIPFRLKPLGGR